MWKYNYSLNLALYHSGVKGMKWGVRRYQKEDGTLTEKGKIRITKRLGKNKNTNYNLPKFIRRKIHKDNVETYTFLRENNFITDSDVEKHKKISEKSSKVWDDIVKTEIDFANNRKISYDDSSNILEKKYKKYDDIVNKSYSNIQNLSINFLSTNPDFKDKKDIAEAFLNIAMRYDDKYYKKK